MGSTSSQKTKSSAFTGRGLELNAILFPAPKSTYTLEELEDELLFIPRIEKVYKELKSSSWKKLYPTIPCLYLKTNRNHSNKTIIYFHGNAEDIALSKDLIYDIHIALNVRPIYSYIELVLSYNSF